MVTNTLCNFPITAVDPKLLIPVQRITLHHKIQI